MPNVLSKTNFEFGGDIFDVIILKNNDDEDKTYFFAKGFAKSLGYKNLRQAIRVNCPKMFEARDIFSRGYGVAPCANFTDIHPQTVIIPESDVFRLIMRSKIPAAVQFQDFVFERLLPSIRKHGQYPPPEETRPHVQQAIGYDIGNHEDRMKHFETLTDEQRKEMRKETLTETNLLKSEDNVNRGRIGGTVNQKNIRDLKKEHRELQKDYEEMEFYFDEVVKYYTEENEKLQNRVHELEIRLAKVCC